MGLVDNSEINHGARAGKRGTDMSCYMALGEGAKKSKQPMIKRLGKRRVVCESVVLEAGVCLAILPNQPTTPFAFPPSSSQIVRQSRERGRGKNCRDFSRVILPVSTVFPSMTFTNKKNARKKVFFRIFTLRSSNF